MGASLRLARSLRNGIEKGALNCNTGITKAKHRVQKGISKPITITRETNGQY